MRPTPLRLAIVTETYPPEINGVAMTVGRMVSGLAARGHQVDLIRPRQQGDSAAADTMLVAGLSLPRYPDLRFGLPAGRRLLKRWRENRPDLVVAVTEGPLGWSALQAARRLGIPAISEFHTNFHSYSAHYGMAWLMRPVRGYLRHFHNRNLATLVPSEDVRARLDGQGFGHLQVVSRGVDTALFDPARRSSELRRTWGAGDATQVVAYVGRMAAEKNLPLVQAAFREMRAIRPDSKLLWVGDGPERSALQASHPQHLFAGMRRGEDLASHYASADIFLFPSTTETYGNVTVEAMASGLGVVAYRYAAAATHIRHHESGLTADFDQREQFIEQARYAASYPSVMRELGRAARQVALQLGWDAVVARFEEVAHAALARAAGN
ncbi:glycosyltransferase family 1 protein [Chitinimonas arctica]|uniref:Glycosyltransferase family 1 protein n=1 Tax=Chitinimonas arctica TaxID=2594795 RepID=A0A516SF16_9NEIS|nr:glycosyltransferase family 1 protein [Chitinimonas arctica]QDQ26755.1 glycosyltransferase family 1 protein [Chitinimonas arctica]